MKRNNTFRLDGVHPGWFNFQKPVKVINHINSVYNPKGWAGLRFDFEES